MPVYRPDIARRSSRAITTTLFLFITRVNNAIECKIGYRMRHIKIRNKSEKSRKILGDLLYKCSAVPEMGDRSATIDMGRKEGLLCPFRGAGKLGPHLTQSSWAEVYLRTKWHLDPSSHLARTNMGRKLGAVPLWGLDTHLTQYRLGRGLPPYQAIDPTVWPQQTWAEKYGVLCPFLVGG